MAKRLVFCFVICFLFLQFVTSLDADVDTEIKIAALPEYEIWLTFINPDAMSEGKNLIVETRKLNSSEDGELSTIFTDDSDNFNLGYSLRKNGTIVISDTVKNITSGETLHLLLMPNIVEVTKNYQEIEEISNEPAEEVGEISNETAEEISNETSEEIIEDTGAAENSEESEDGFFSKINPLKLWALLKLSGFATSEDEESSSKNIFYYIGGIVFLGLLVAFWVFMHKRKKMKDGGNSQRRFASDEDELTDAERKILEAQEEINELKGKKKSNEPPPSEAFDNLGSNF